MKLLPLIVGVLYIAIQSAAGTAFLMEGDYVIAFLFYATGGLALYALVKMSKP